MKPSHSRGIAGGFPGSGREKKGGVAAWWPMIGAAHPAAAAFGPSHLFSVVANWLYSYSDLILAAVCHGSPRVHDDPRHAARCLDGVGRSSSAFGDLLLSDGQGQQHTSGVSCHVVSDRERDSPRPERATHAGRRKGFESYKGLAAGSYSRMMHGPYGGLAANMRMPSNSAA